MTRVNGITQLWQAKVKLCDRHQACYTQRRSNTSLAILNASELSPALSTKC